MLEYCFESTRRGRTIKSLSAVLAACALALAVSGCAGLDQVALWRTHADRQRIYQLYGDCLHAKNGDLATLAKYCNSIAETRRAREKAEAPSWLFLSNPFSCPCD